MLLSLDVSAARISSILSPDRGFVNCTDSRARKTLDMAGPGDIIAQSGIIHNRHEREIRDMSIEKVEALEERITRVIELVKNLKEEKHRLEGELAALRDELAYKKALEEEVDKLQREKEQVRERLENILKGIDQLSV